VLNPECRICQFKTIKFGLLYKCENKNCGGVQWDKAGVKKALLEDPDAYKQILSDADVPERITGLQSHFVYILRLRGELNAVYVGMTGLHPYARYLNHIRGYKSSRHTKKRATALIRFEGPMSASEAKQREPELAQELRLQNYVVYGGH
jgi:predicted GIY-YIG superfamily endonuclease